MSVTVSTPVTATTGSHNEDNLSWSHTVASGTSLLLVAVAINYDEGQDRGRVTALAYGSAACTKLDVAYSTYHFSGRDRRVELWYLASPTSGTDTVTVATDTIDTYSIAGVSSDLSGVDTADPFGTVASAITPADATSVAVDVTAAPGALIFAAGSARTASSPSWSGATSATGGSGVLAGSNVYGDVASTPAGDGATRTVTYSWSPASAGAVLAVPIQPG